MIETMKSLPNTTNKPLTIQITLEGVAQRVAKLDNARQIDDNDKLQCSFDNVSQLKDTMMAYYFRDKNVHIIYSPKIGDTAEYVIRAARTLADARFKKLRVNQLSVSDHNL